MIVPATELPEFQAAEQRIVRNGPPGSMLFMQVAAGRKERAELRAPRIHGLLARLAARLCEKCELDEVLDLSWDGSHTLKPVRLTHHWRTAILSRNGEGADPTRTPQLRPAALAKPLAGHESGVPSRSAGRLDETAVRGLDPCA